MKEIIEALGSRIKSPVFGYFLFAFIATNWRQLFVLFLSNEKPIVRIETFDNTTNFLSLILIPFVIASIVAIIYPWVNYTFLYLTTKPGNLRNLLQVKADHIMLIEKQKLEEERARLLSVKESNIIDQAQRDIKVEQIEDKQIREKVRAEIESLRSDLSKSNDSKIRNIAEEEINTLMKMAEVYRQKASNNDISYDEKNELKRRAQEAEARAHQKLMETTI